MLSRFKKIDFSFVEPVILVIKAAMTGLIILAVGYNASRGIHWLAQHSALPASSKNLSVPKNQKVLGKHIKQ